ncbi:ABC transporter permease [Aestuariivirga sp.]|uniref:ABC transporter permease n=1 Tax=Aestuariivirga sp. TaxID=2650926 RepID=UPI00391A18E5
MLLTYERLGSLRILLWAVTLAVCVFLLVPIVFIIALSFGSSKWLVFPPPAWTLRWYEALAADPRWLTAALTSLKIGLLVTVCSVLLGLMASLAVIRGRFPGRQFLSALFLTPMILPVVVFAVATYLLFLRVGLGGTLIGFVIAHTVLAFPFAFISINNSLESFDKSIEDAAVLCGAHPMIAFLKITVPSIRLGLFSAALFSFLISWDEVVVAIFMASPELQTLPVLIWAALRQELSPTIAAASSLLVLITLITIILIAMLRRRFAE